jgi:hypothetical protein
MDISSGYTGHRLRSAWKALQQHRRNYEDEHQFLDGFHS